MKYSWLKAERDRVPIKEPQQSASPFSIGSGPILRTWRARTIRRAERECADSTRPRSPPSAPRSSVEGEPQEEKRLASDHAVEASVT